MPRSAEEPLPRFNDGKKERLQLSPIPSRPTSPEALISTLNLGEEEGTREDGRGLRHRVAQSIRGFSQGNFTQSDHDTTHGPGAGRSFSAQLTQPLSNQSHPHSLGALGVGGRRVTSVSSSPYPDRGLKGRARRQPYRFNPSSTLDSDSDMDEEVTAFGGMGQDDSLSARMLSHKDRQAFVRGLWEGRNEDGPPTFDPPRYLRSSEAQPLSAPTFEPPSDVLGLEELFDKQLSIQDQDNPHVKATRLWILRQYRWSHRIIGVVLLGLSIAWFWSSLPSWVSFLSEGDEESIILGHLALRSQLLGSTHPSIP